MISYGLSYRCGQIAVDRYSAGVKGEGLACDRMFGVFKTLSDEKAPSEICKPSLHSMVITDICPTSIHVSLHAVRILIEFSSMLAAPPRAHSGSVHVQILVNFCRGEEEPSVKLDWWRMA